MIVTDTPPEFFPNRHRETSLVSKVNKIGPFSRFFFGSLLPEDSISRRVVYDMAGGNSFGIGFSKPLARRRFGFGMGATCSTEPPPEPLPDPFPDFELGGGSGSGCYDNGCSTVHGDCNPHSCKGNDCGCYPDNPTPN
jgi:hypothetical protein